MREVRVSTTDRVGACYAFLQIDIISLNNFLLPTVENRAHLPKLRFTNVVRPAHAALLC